MKNKKIRLTIPAAVIALLVMGCTGQLPAQGVSSGTLASTELVPGTSAVTGSSQATEELTAPDNGASQGQSATTISEERAREIALTHAGLTEKDVTFILSHPDFDDGRYVYDVEFYKDMTEYDYEIDAYSGAILSFDFDIESYAAAPQQQAQAPAQTPAAPQQTTPSVPQAPAAPQQTPQTPAAPQPAAAAITLDQAKQIALNHAGVAAANAVFTESEFDYDDGYPVYQIDFIAGNMEYEVEVDANTGAIREYDAESVYD